MTNLCVLVLEDDDAIIDQWGYVLPAFGVKKENSYFPWANKRRMRWCSDGNPPECANVVIAQPEDAVFIQGQASLSDYSFGADTLLVFGPTHKHMTDQMIELVPNFDRASLVFIESMPTCQLDSVNAGAVFLYEYRRQHGWPDN